MLAALSSIIALAFAPSVVENGFAFFLTAEVVIVLALISYLMLPLLVCIITYVLLTSARFLKNFMFITV